MRWNDTGEYFPPPYLDYNATKKETKSVLVTVWRPYLENLSVEIGKYVETPEGEGWANADGKMYGKHEIVKAWAWLPKPYELQYFSSDLEWEDED